MFLDTLGQFIFWGTIFIILFYYSDVGRDGQ